MAEDAVTIGPVSAPIPCQQGKEQGNSPILALVGDLDIESSRALNGLQPNSLRNGTGELFSANRECFWTEQGFIRRVDGDGRIDLTYMAARAI